MVTKKGKSKGKIRSGKAGALATHKKRYEALAELESLVDGRFMIHLRRWPTVHILKLLEAYKTDVK